MAWARGRLRLSFGHTGTVPPASGEDVLDEHVTLTATPTAVPPQLVHAAAPIDWKRFGFVVSRQGLPPEEVVEAVFDTYGIESVIALPGLVDSAGEYCLAIANLISSREIDGLGSERTWAYAALGHGLPPGAVRQLVDFDIELPHVNDLLGSSRDTLLNLTRAVQQPSVRWETGILGEWLDASTLAAHVDPLGLAAAEALIDGPGWYRCWLKFFIGLARATAAPGSDQPDLILSAMDLLLRDLNPFSGDPRACDLYSIEGVIEDTFLEALLLLNEETWERGLGILNEVSGETTTTSNFAGIGGPLPPDRLLKLAAETAPKQLHGRVLALINEEMTEGSAGRYYSDLAEYRLLAARLAIAENDQDQARQFWIDAARMLVAYGWHKDITVYELLDPLPALIEVDQIRGRERVAVSQPIVERAAMHTDGRETRGGRERWWRLLALADPIRLGEIVLEELLKDCHDPHYLLHEARQYLWREWNSKADPLVAGALRLTLEEPLQSSDAESLAPLASTATGTDDHHIPLLLTLLASRVDERPVEYSVTNSDELLDQDDRLVDAINSAIASAGVPRINRQPRAEPRESSNSRFTSQPEASAEQSLLPPVWRSFDLNPIGLARAIRAWRGRRYDEISGEWDPDRIANIFGYRVIELAQAERDQDAINAIWLIADAAGFADRSGVLVAIAAGLDRHGHARLAATAYTLAWTRTRGHGGWLTFGGETEINSLHRASELDADATNTTLTREIQRAISTSRYGSYGISQALVLAFAHDALRIPGRSSRNMAFAVWDEAYSVIAARTPRVHASDDPDYPYTAPPADHVDPPGALDSAFAKAAVAGLSLPWRENMRRALLALRLLLHHRPDSAAPAMHSALSFLSEPSTLSWMLQELAAAAASTAGVVERCQSPLAGLAQGPDLTVRALARRLLTDPTVPLAPLGGADPQLTASAETALWVPGHDGADDPAPQQGGFSSKGLADLVKSTAGRRLAAGEPLLPGLTEAVLARVTEHMTDERRQTRMRHQLDAYGDRVGRRWPDAYLDAEESVERALQRAAAGARSAKLLTGSPLVNPLQWEDELAQRLADDPYIPLALEGIRQPRPAIPFPPPRGDRRWTNLQEDTDTAAGDSQPEGVTDQASRLLSGTIDIAVVEIGTELIASPLGGWLLVATYEQATFSVGYGTNSNQLESVRFQCLELREAGDDAELASPPVAVGDVRAWLLPPPSLTLTHAQSQPVIGLDMTARATGDSPATLGVHRPLLTPTLYLISRLALRPGDTPFTLSDEQGPALRLIVWRARYDTSDYHLPSPQMIGCGVLMRDDTLARLIGTAPQPLVLREYIYGDPDLARSSQDNPDATA
jgi:hypothetical protein